MLKGWKLAETSNSGYTYENRKYPSLYVTINPWGTRDIDSLMISVRAEDTVIADMVTTSNELLHDEEVLQEFLEDVEDITSSFMKSFERIMSWFDRYTDEQCVIFLLLTDADNKDIRNLKKEYRAIDKKFDNLFY